MAARVTQDVVEVALSATDRRARVTQVVVEVTASPAPPAAGGQRWSVGWIG